MNGNTPDGGIPARQLYAIRVRLTVVVGRVELMQRRSRRGYPVDQIGHDLALVRTSLDDVITEVNRLDIHLP